MSPLLELELVSPLLELLLVSPLLELELELVSPLLELELVSPLLDELLLVEGGGAGVVSAPPALSPLSSSSSCVAS